MLYGPADGLLVAVDHRVRAVSKTKDPQAEQCWVVLGAVHRFLNFSKVKNGHRKILQELPVKDLPLHTF